MATVTDIHIICADFLCYLHHLGIYSVIYGQYFSLRYLIQVENSQVTLVANMRTRTRVLCWNFYKTFDLTVCPFSLYSPYVPYSRSLCCDAVIP